MRRRQDALLQVPREPDPIYHRVGVDEAMVFSYYLALQCEKWLSFTQSTPMGHVLRTAARARAAANHDCGIPRLLFSTDKKRLCYEDIVVAMDGLRLAMRGMIVDAERMLMEKLLLYKVPAARGQGAEGLILAALHEMLPAATMENLVDRRGAGDGTRNFVDDNDCLRDMAHLVADRTTQPASRLREWYLVDAERGPCVHLGRLEQYLADVEDFLRLLLCLTYLAGGMPPRGTELVGVRWRAGNGQRDVVLAFGVAMIITRYNKTQHITGLDRATPHFLPRRVTRILVLYLSAVEPFVTALREVRRRLLEAGGVAVPVAGPEQQFLFCDAWGDHFSSGVLSSSLQQEFKRRLGVDRLGIAVWRQMIKAIALAMLNMSEAEKRESGVLVHDDPSAGALLDSGVHRQFGHASEVGSRLYGGLVDNAPGLTTTSINVMQCLSERYHQLFEIDGDVAPSALVAREPQPNVPRHPRSWHAATVDDAELRAALRQLYGGDGAF